MLKTHFKFAFRSMMKYPGFSFLNIAGLTLGIAASFVILMYTWQELRTDRHFADYDSIYRVSTDFFDMGGFAASQQQLHDKLLNYKDVEYATRLQRGYQEIPVEINSNTWREPYYFSTDSNYFKIFSYHFIEGSANLVLHSPDEVVLSEKLAKKYFGNQAAFGKFIKIGKDKKSFRVTGVVRDNDYKTHLLADMWMPVYESVKPENSTNWNSARFYNYVKLSPHATESNLRNDLNDILKKDVYPSAASTKPFAEWKTDPKSIRFIIEPLKDIYLHSNLKFEIAPGGNPTQIYILGIIGIFIILIAAINYVNLTTARASVRAKEVGIKKTLGAARPALIMQFLSETIYTSIVAMILAVFLAQGLIAIFESLTGTRLVNGSLIGVQQLIFLFGFVLLIGILAGLYPAFYLTGFRPKKILKGDLTIKGNKNFRSSLVVFQFSLAIGLIICTMVVYKQLHFMQNKDKGFTDRGVISVNNAGVMGNNVTAFTQAINSRSEVISTSRNQRTPAGKSLWMYTYQTPEMKDALTFQTFPADENYIPTLGMHLIAGRNFSKDFPTDTAAAIINEAAVKELGLKHPIGAQINEGQKVIGVISDFNFQSMHEKIAPVVLMYSKDGYQYAIRIKGTKNLAGFRNFIETEWKKYSDDEPIQYTFLDEDFAALADKEKILSKAVTFFTMLALIIASIGLFALSTFTIEQRIKEIGIRKVLGANVKNIISLLSKDFMKLVVIAAFIAFPLAWWMMHTWLQDFAYRVDIGWWIFIASGLAALIIALITVSFQAVKAAIANPVKSLRSE